MKKIIAAAVLAALIASPAYAALAVGAKAPDFATQGSLGGKSFDFKLTEALKKGPVVIYFFRPPIPRAAPSKPKRSLITPMNSPPRARR